MNRVYNQRRLVKASNRAHLHARLRCEDRFSQKIHRTKRSNGGFTLLELLIVIVVLAIAALTAIPMMSSAATLQIRSAANMIAADLEYAKSMSISRGQSYSVVFDTVAESYQIEDQAGIVIGHPVKKGFNYIVNFRNDGLDQVDISSADFSGGTVVQFNCLGSPDNGGSVVLQAANATVTIAVEPVTGYISITDL